VKQAPPPAQRRHTLYFLDEIRAVSPVFLDTDVDMTRVQAHRRAAQEHGRSYSVVAYLLYAAARTLAAHPAANAAIHGRLRPRVAYYDRVNAKLTLDKTLGGQRVVLATVLRNVHEATLDDIQSQIERFRDGDPDTMPEFAAMRQLHRLPPALGGPLFRRATRPLRKRPETMGTLAVTSLGHRPVDSFFSVGGTTVTLGLGRVVDRPVATGGKVVVAPMMRVALTFDHRVIDGAEAADVLADLKGQVEEFGCVAELSQFRQSARRVADLGETGRE